MQGGIYKHMDGTVEYDLTYTWNDVMDPNKYVLTDTVKVALLKVMKALNPDMEMTLKNYDVHISWSNVTTINPNDPSLSSGWLAYGDPNFVSDMEKVIKRRTATIGDRELKMAQEQFGEFLEQLNLFKEENAELYGCDQSK